MSFERIRKSRISNSPGFYIIDEKNNKNVIGIKSKKSMEQTIYNSSLSYPKIDDWTATENSITCCLQGGMGNQMFQYATAKALSIKLELPLLLNITRFDYCVMREYSLGLWKGVNETITNLETHRIKEIGLGYNSGLISKIGKGNSMIGYWQTESYFREIKEILQEIFVPKQELTERGKKTLERIKEAGDRSVFLTIRRTDYVTSDFHGVLSKEYYDKAISLIAEKVENPVIFIFSDEPDWCEKNLHIDNSIVVGHEHAGNKFRDYLHLMSKFKNFIIPNSTFAWWAAWISDNQSNSTKIISPGKKLWFRNNPEIAQLIIPNNWDKLDSLE
jgi:hypothetical protein